MPELPETWAPYPFWGVRRKPHATNLHLTRHTNRGQPPSTNVRPTTRRGGPDGGSHSGRDGMRGAALRKTIPPAGATAAAGRARSAGQGRTRRSGGAEPALQAVLAGCL